MGDGAVSKIGIRWKGPSLDPSGYGEATRNYIKGCYYSGLFDIQVEPWNFEKKDGSFYGDSGILVEKLKENKVDHSVVFVHCVPNQISGFIEPGKLNVGYSTWETDRIPKHWVKNINNHFDLQLVPSEYNKQVYINSGVTVPIEVLPHCIHMAEIDSIPAADLEMYANKFKFISVFQWTERKNPIGLLKAYFAEFWEHNDVVLILKSYRSNASQIEQDKIINDIKHLKNDMDLPKYPPIYFIGSLIPHRNVFELYKASDCFVLPSRSEGFGIPILEAMSCSLPIVTTNYGGGKELLYESASNVGYFETPVCGMPWIPYYDSTQLWAEPNIADLRFHMHKMYISNKESIEKESKWSYKRAWNFDISTISKKFYEILKKYGA